ncbi:MAG TPA: tetratricopeptide repeat protein, partial [Polyangiaceae bacterium]
MTRQRLARLLLVATALGASVAPSAPAAAQSDSEIALAKQWFRDGEAAEKKKDWAKALDLFEKALTVKQTPQIYIRVGTLQERLGKLVEALVSYERAQEKASGAQLADVVNVAKEAAEAIRPRVPTVLLAPAQHYPGLAVTLDGAALAPATLADKLPINPGTHKLSARAPNREGYETSFVVAEKEAKRLPFDLKASATPAAPPPDAAVGAPSATPDTPPASPPSKAIPIVLVAGGVVALGAGVVLFIVGQGKAGDVATACPDSAACHVTSQAQQDDITASTNTANTLRAVGAVV